MADKPNKPDINYPDWNAMLEEGKQIHFLKREIKRLMRLNDGLEFHAQLAYAFGYGDSKGGLDFDSEFCIEDISIEQDDDDNEIWTAQRNDQPTDDDPEDE